MSTVDQSHEVIVVEFTVVTFQTLVQQDPDLFLISKEVLLERLKDLFTCHGLRHLSFRMEKQCEA
jgi:hypothetical protein